MTDAVRSHGVGEASTVRLEKVYNEGTGTRILHKQSEKFPVGKDVRGRDSLSKVIYRFSTEAVLGKLGFESGIQGKRKYFIYFLFSNDVVLFSESKEDLKIIVECLNSESPVIYMVRYV